LDVLLGFILGSLLSRGITGHASLSGTAVASAALVAVHFALSAGAFRWHALGNLIKGCPYQLVDNGTLIMENMRHSHISIDDLWEELRLNGVEDLSKVKSAYKERNGQVSVIKMT